MQMDLAQYQNIKKALRSTLQTKGPIKATTSAQCAAVMLGFKSNEALTVQLKKSGSLDVAPRPVELNHWLEKHSWDYFSGYDLIGKVFPEYKEIMFETDDEWQLALGFSINTSDGHVIEDNVREIEDLPDGVDPENLPWETLTQDCLGFEMSMIRYMAHQGILCRNEGHDGYDDMIGTAWMNLANPRHCYFIYTALQDGADEYWDHTDLNDFEYCMKDISDLGKRVIDARLNFQLNPIEQSSETIDLLVEHIRILSDQFIADGGKL